MGWVVSGNIKGATGAAGADGADGADGISITIETAVADYASLPSGLDSTDAGKSYEVLADGKLYQWSGSAFPADGAGVPFRGPTGAEGAAGEGITIAGSVANYAALPGGLGAGDAGDGYMVIDGGAYDDGLLYIWDGDSFPAEGAGVAFQGPVGPAGETGPTGATGSAGADGDDGADGARGSLWYTGTGTPSGIPGTLANDLFLDTATGDVYQYSD